MRDTAISFSSNLRSTLVLPPDNQSRVVAGINGVSIRQGPVSSRATLSLSPRFQTLHQSTSRHLPAQIRGYDEIALLKYISQSKLESKIKVDLPFTLSMFPVAGQGRTFTVRRWPTGWGREMAPHNLLAAASGVKSLRSSALDEPYEELLRYRSLIQELRVLLHGSLRKHINFVKLQSLGWEADTSSPGIFLPNLTLEFATFSTLQNFLLALNITYAWKQRIVLDVAEGLFALHSCSIAHCDVKMENVLMFPCEDPNFPVVAKLTDFGFSVDLLNEPMVVGLTPVWAAPELLCGDVMTRLDLCDVYALGFIVWSVATAGQSPFEALNFIDADLLETNWTSWKRTNELVDMAVAQICSTDTIPPDTDIEEVCHLLSSTLQRDPKDRSLQDVLDCLRGRCDRAVEMEGGRGMLYSIIEPFNPVTVRTASNDAITRVLKFHTGQRATRAVSASLAESSPSIPVRRSSREDSRQPKLYF
jgi:serine/threonine protein kinase